MSYVSVLVSHLSKLKRAGPKKKRIEQIECVDIFLDLVPCWRSNPESFEFQSNAYPLGHTVDFLFIS